MKEDIKKRAKKGGFYMENKWAKYHLNEDDLDFLKALYEELVEEQSPVCLSCNGYGFQIDPCGKGAEIWHLGEKVGVFNSIDELFLQFEIDGKTFIERLSDMDYE